MAMPRETKNVGFTQQWMPAPTARVKLATRPVARFFVQLEPSGEQLPQNPPLSAAK
jgi:hypothetical protein